MKERRTEERLNWETAAPLLTNRFFLYDIVKGLGWAGGIMIAMMGVMFSIQGDPEMTLEMLPVLGIALLVILVILIFVSAVIFGNRWHVRFTVDARGITWEQLRRRNWGLLALAASFSGHPTAAGAGVLTTTMNAGRVTWREIRRVREHPSQHVISVMNGWRVVLRVYCASENYPQVVDMVRRRVARAAERAAASGRRKPS